VFSRRFAGGRLISRIAISRGLESPHGENHTRYFVTGSASQAITTGQAEEAINFSELRYSFRCSESHSSSEAGKNSLTTVPRQSVVNKEEEHDKIPSTHVQYRNCNRSGLAARSSSRAGRRELDNMGPDERR
jgi:hypothetical protein